MDTNDTPLFRSSPERIGLAFGDEDGLWQIEFDDCNGVTWYESDWHKNYAPVSVAIEYVRLDVYENLKVEFDSFADDVERSNRKNLSFATVCVRDEEGITVGGALNRQREMIGELRAELAAASERAEALQRTINEALSQSPAATIVEIDDGLGTTFLEFHEPRGPAGTNYYAAPVLSQPAVVPTYEIVMSSGRKARLTAPELVDRLAACTVEIERLRGERKTRPAVVPEEVRKMRETLFDISTSDVLSDRSENTHVTVAIDRDTFRQAAILSTTEGLKDVG